MRVPRRRTGMRLGTSGLALSVTAHRIVRPHVSPPSVLRQVQDEHGVPRPLLEDRVRESRIDQGTRQLDRPDQQRLRAQRRDACGGAVPGVLPAADQVGDLVDQHEEGVGVRASRRSVAASTPPTAPTTGPTCGNAPHPPTPTSHPGPCCCTPSPSNSDGKPNTPPPNSPPADHHLKTVRQPAIKPPERRRR